MSDIFAAPATGRRGILIGAGLAGLGWAAGAHARTETPFASRQGQFRVRVDDAEMFCEVTGSGPLLILINGMWLDSFTHHGRGLIDAFARRYRVLTFDQRGQGGSAVGSGPISYGRFAADTVRLMDVLGIPSAHFFGHSDGGIIQLYMMLNYPERMRSAMMTGASYDQSSYRADSQAGFRQWYDDALAGKPVPLSAEQQARYAKIAPDPARYADMVRAQHIAWSTEPNISLRQLAFARTPTLVIDAGKDEYMPSETFQALGRAIPGARVIAYPDMTHDIKPYADQLVRVSADFTRALP